MELERDNWERHWDRYAAAAEVNPAQAYRRALILEVLAAVNPAHAGRIVDVGSGQGDLLVRIARDYADAQLLGIEMSQSGIREASAKVPAAAFWQHNLLHASDEDCPYRGWAQYAVCAEVLEHLDNPDLFLHNLTRFLAPGCALIVTVPGGPMSVFDRHIGHRRHYAARELRALLARCGFDVQWAHGAGFPFFNLYRFAVIVRGKKLIADAAGETANTIPARLLAGTFRFLFSANARSGSLGWQTIAMARWPG